MSLHSTQADSFVHFFKSGSPRVVAPAAQAKRRFFVSFLFDFAKQMADVSQTRKEAPVVPKKAAKEF